MKLFARIFMAMLALLLVSGFAMATPVTFNVDMSHQQTLGNFDPLLDGVGIRGSMNGWGGADGLEDLDLDMIYTTTLELDSGFYEYKFVIWIGNDPDNVIWETNINNRTVDVAYDPIILDPVWFDNDSPVVTNYEVTFRVNMDVQEQLGVFDPDVDAIIIRGGREEIGNWGGFTPIPRLGMSTIYCTEIQFDDLEPGNLVDYKFLIDYDNDGMDPVEWEIVGGPWDNRSFVGVGDEPDDDNDTYLEISLDPTWFSLAEPSDLGTAYVAPYDYPVEVPAEGGMITFEFWLHNNLTNPFVADVWLSAQLPTGPTINLAPVQVPLTPGETFWQEDVEVEVPGYAPAGAYVITINAGIFPGFIGASDSFEMTKLGAATGGAWGWSGADQPLAMGEEVAELSTIASEYALNAAYPNPFNPTTSVSVSLPEAAELNVFVYNVQGRLVTTLAQGSFNAGQHNFTFDASNMASGLYFIQAQVPGQMSEIQKVTLMK